MLGDHLKYQNSNHNAHVIDRNRYIDERRFWNRWYRGKVSRMTQLKQLRERGDMAGYRWLKDYWREELTGVWPRTSPPIAAHA